MSDFVDLTGNMKPVTLERRNELHYQNNTDVLGPSYDSLQLQLFEAGKLVDDIVLKNYLTKLDSMEILPLDDDLKDISDIRLFKINEMVYQKDEYSTYKFASVFNAVQNLNCGVFVIADSDGKSTDFYMGVRSLDNKRTTKSLKDTLRNALSGQFPGVKTLDLLDPQAQAFIEDIESKNIASVSCVAKNKNEGFDDNEKFIQGLEKLALAMQGQRYTAVLLAKSTPNDQLRETRQAYENIYTKISPFANMQMSYGKNSALNISEAFSKGMTIGSSHSATKSTQVGSSYSKGANENNSISERDKGMMIAKGAGTALLGVASIVTAPLTGGASLAAAGAIMAGNVGLSMIDPATHTKGSGTSENWTDNKSETAGVTNTTNESTTENRTKTEALTTGTSENMQLTIQNKTIINTLERIDLQLQRIEECESLGMWESAAYFLSDSQETAEMAAGTYKALMKGEKSGVETSAINFWGRQNKEELPLLREYITNFIHPVFKYESESVSVPVTASSLVSGNELAIKMGLPRKSVCGFPVIEHADFGKEVVKYQGNERARNFTLGHVYSMGKENDTEVKLDKDSLTMHTFVTGSTGSGKSNTVYEMLNQLRNVYNIPFLVVEPAKGEYKNIFGHYNDVTVYGTNPSKATLLRINPFRFPDGIHVLEHLDRLVEIFNVCWPMYAAMPAILKEAMQNAYVNAGWDISKSANSKGDIYPNFKDLLEEIENVISESKYSADSKGDYSGALLTRVRSLTTGLDGLIFCSDDLSDADLFDKNVIVDLSRVGSMDTKSLIMGLLVMRLNEYRMSAEAMNSTLRHITVLEEAHNLLKRTSTEQAAESSNLVGKSVEMLANSIAEMRTYGEGFIIGDQSPGLLDMSVIRNTNTKIILRLLEKSDRELVGYAASLNNEQIAELAKLERGVAAVYQNDWNEPVLLKVNKCNVQEKAYMPKKHISSVNQQEISEQLLMLLIQGKVIEKLDYNIDQLENGLHLLELSSRNREFVDEQIAEYKDSNRLAIWSEDNFRLLAKRVTDLMEVRAKVENVVVTSRDNDELTNKLSRFVKDSIPTASDNVILSIMQCMLKDFSIGVDEREYREKAYKQWVENIKERGATFEF